MGTILLRGMLSAMTAESKTLKLASAIQASKRPTRMALQLMLKLIRRRLGGLVDA
jgi:hypothetical protein